MLAGAVHLDKVDSFSMRIVGRRGGLGRAEMKRRRDGRREKEQTGGWGDWGMGIVSFSLFRMQFFRREIDCKRRFF